AEAARDLKAGGLVAGVAEHGQVRYLAAGKALDRPGVPPEKVLFETGSITKVFTSLLLGQAVIEHRVALTDPIRKYVPAEISLDPAVAAITLEQLATHTSGLPRLPDN